MSEFNERKQAQELLAKAKKMEKQFTSDSGYRRVKADHRTTFLTRSNPTPKEESKVEKTEVITLESIAYGSLVLKKRIKADKEGLYFESSINGKPARNSIEFSESAIEYLRKLLK